MIRRVAFRLVVIVNRHSIRIEKVLDVVNRDRERLGSPTHSTEKKRPGKTKESNDKHAAT